MAIELDTLPSTLLRHDKHLPQRAEETLLQHILKNVSRSFYLSLRILPSSVRTQVSLAYLFCRAADIITDIPIFPHCRRLQILQAFRRQFFLATPSLDDLQHFRPAVLPQHTWQAECRLLHHLPDCFRVFGGLAALDQQLIRELVLTLTHGMEMDLKYFPGETASSIHAFPDLATLDLYTYYVAGVVGGFWTKIHQAYMQTWQPREFQTLCALGVRFGQGLQMTNILKDLGKDLAIGRCYLPKEWLEPLAITTEELTRPVTLPRLQPLIAQLTWHTLEHLDEACQYVLQLPGSAWRLRLSCMWPLLFAVQTLAIVNCSEGLLDPESRVKISRGVVYRTMVRSIWCLIVPGMFASYYAFLRQRLTTVLHHTGDANEHRRKSCEP